MRLMRIIGGGAAVCGLLLLSVPVVAGPHGGHMERRIERMQEWLGLSDEQAEDVRLIFQQVRHKGQCRQIEDSDARRTCIRAKREAISEELSAILTEQQLEEFEAWRAERKARWGERRQGRSHK